MWSLGTPAGAGGCADGTPGGNGAGGARCDRSAERLPSLQALKQAGGGQAGACRWSHKHFTIQLLRLSHMITCSNSACVRGRACEMATCSHVHGSLMSEIYTFPSCVTTRFEMYNML